MRLAPEVLFKERNRGLKYFLENSIFYKNYTLAKFNFFSVFAQLWDPFTPWSRSKSKKLNIFRTKFSHWVIRILQNQGPIWSQFFRKNTITFCSILAVFWWKKGRGQGLKGWNQNLTCPIAVSQFLGIFQSKRFGPSTCQFCGYRLQRSCFFNFEPLFQVWLLF